MSELSPLQVVQAWQDALNRGDVEAVLGLSDPDIEIVGPRGLASGHDVLKQWLQHTRVQLVPKRSFAQDETVVVEQRGIWKSLQIADLVSEADVVSVFRVRGGCVAHYARFDTLAAALEHAGLTPGELDQT